MESISSQGRLTKKKQSVTVLRAFFMKKKQKYNADLKSFLN